MKDLLKAFPVVTEIKVRWGEMDSAQHVNNVAYLRWAETARFDYFEALKFPVAPDENGFGIILGWQDCKYILPVIYPDDVFIGTRLKNFEQDRFYIESHFFSKKYNRLAAISLQRIVCYDYNKKCKVNVPDHIKKQINDFEKNKTSLPED